MTDLAYRRELEGQTCADTVLYHIAADCQWWQDQRNVRPACASFWPDGPTSSPLTWKADVKGSRLLQGNRKDVWPSQAGLDSHLVPSLQTKPPDTSVYTTLQQKLYNNHNCLSQWLSARASYWGDFFGQRLKKNHSYKQLICDTH